MFREDFEIFKSGIIYFDNGATTLKPNILSTVTTDYYTKYTANAHRGDYDNSLIVDEKYENARELVSNFINASSKEIIFTSGTTDSINKIVFGYFKNHLKENDEVIITKAEHASNVLPWYELAEEKKLNIKFAPLNNEHKLTLDSIKSVVTSNTKVISIAHITNVIGDVRDIKSIISFAHKNNILVLIDGAQSVAHTKVDVKDLDIDFLAFSAHKMCGPTGVGILYGKEALLKEMKPITFGGGMNNYFEADLSREYHELPHSLEAGTPNIAGVIGYGEVIKYINNIGIDNIHNYEMKLRSYAIEKLKEIKDIIIYNETSESGIIAFNYKDVFAQDLAIYLNKYKICVRAGNHCAKMLKDELNIKNTCRISLYFYNTYEEIDYLVKVLNNPDLKKEVI